MILEQYIVSWTTLIGVQELMALHTWNIISWIMDWMLYKVLDSRV